MTSTANGVGRNGKLKEALLSLKLDQVRMPLGDMVPSGTYMGATMQKQQECHKNDDMSDPHP